MDVRDRRSSSILEMERPSSQAGRRGPRRSVAGYEHIEQTQELMTSIIHELVHTGDLSALKEELRRDKQLIECLNSEGMTPLFVAVSTGNLELVQYLATSGAFLNTKDILGRTAIALAAYQGWNDGVYYLLAVGADQTIVDNCGRLPLHAATYYSNEKTVELLLRNLSPEFINTQDCEGMTAFHWAAFHGRSDLVRPLVQNSAEIIARDNEGKTPLHWAAQSGSVECCRAILSTPTGQHLLNGKDFSGKTPIHFAAAAGHLDALQELISEKFVNFSLGDAEGRTPLHWAAATGHAHCAVALLRTGADKDCVDKDGASPLMYAQQRGHKLCCSLIFQHDPDNPLNTEMPENIETGKTSTPPEIHIDSSPSNKIEVKTLTNGMHGSAKRDGLNKQADPEDDEVQEILRKSVETVEVLVEVNNSSERNGEEGRISSLLHDLRKPSPSGSLTTSAPSWIYSPQLNMNGHHSDGDSTGYSSDDEARYPPQMVLTPIPGSSPIPTEDDNNNYNNENPIKPPGLFQRYSFEENIHAPFLKPPSTAAVLAPLRPRKVPEHLRLDVGYNSSSCKTFEFKPVTSSTTEPILAPLKITKAKQSTAQVKPQGLPAVQQSMSSRQLVTSPTKIQRAPGSAQNQEGTTECSFWARKKKPDSLLKASSSSSRTKQMNRSLSIPDSRTGSGKGASGYSDGPEFRQLDNEPDFSLRKHKDKQQSASSSGGQMLPAISNDKPNRVSQVQGSLRDQIAKFRRSVKKKPSKTKTGHSSLDSTDEGYAEEDRRNKPKEKKKIRKVMSWNT